MKANFETLAPLERIAILRQNGICNTLSQRDRVDRSVLSEATQHRELSDQRVAFDRSCQCRACFFFDVVHGVVNERPGGIAHHAGRFAPFSRGFLRPAERRFHGVYIHGDIGQRCHNLLMLGELLPEPLNCGACSQKENLLGLRQRTLLFSEWSRIRLFK